MRLGLSHDFFPLQTILQHLSDLPLHSRNVSNRNKVVLLKKNTFFSFAVVFVYTAEMFPTEIRQEV